MSPKLSTAVCSITSTQRRRYFWAAWWTAEPSFAPFRQPDAAHGGARSFEEALNEAQAVAGRTLTLIDSYWARAWKSVLRGQQPSPPPAAREQARAGVASPPPAAAVNVSAWSVLGLQAGASLAEVKRAYQQRALQTHPDRGGSADEFRLVQRAYEKLIERLEAKAARPQARHTGQARGR